MKTTRKRYTGEFKAKVALEAIRGDLTLAELATRHGIHPTMIATWKRQAIEGMAATLLGATDAAKATGDAEVEKLHAKVGQPVVERDFSSKVRDERHAAAGDARAGTCAPECVYLNAFETGSELRTGLGRWMSYHNGHRPHSRFGGRTPDEVYGQIGATPCPRHAPDMAPTRMAA